MTQALREMALNEVSPPPPPAKGTQASALAIGIHPPLSPSRGSQALLVLGRNCLVDFGLVIVVVTTTIIVVSHGHHTHGMRAWSRACTRYPAPMPCPDIEISYSHDTTRGSSF